MPRRSPGALTLDYGLAVAVSLVSLGIVAGLQHYVGYVPMLFLPAIVLVQAWLGIRPAVLTTVLCSMGSLLLMADGLGGVSEKVHVWANLLLLPGTAVVLIYLMETRRRHQKIEHERGVELSILLQSMPEAVFIFDTGARVIEFNRSAGVLCDCTRGELQGMRLRDLAGRLLSRENEPPSYDKLAVTRALRGEQVRDEARVLRDPSDAKPMQTMLSANPMRDEHGHIIGAVLVIRDITEVRELQSKIADTERHLAIGQMAAGIAHDFNNVLDTISQASAVMEMRLASAGHDGDLSSYIRMIQNAVRRGAEIIHRVREYIRGGTGEQLAVNLCTIIEEALELTSPMWRELPKMKVTRDLHSVPPVRGNPADLRRVFANLIINSLQAMPEGGEITVRCREANGRVEASVADNGPGIPLTLQRKIFLPYFTTKPSGTGLGLSGAQRIVQAAGGDITFSSEPGQGTTFTMTLPKLGTEESRKVA